jgi:hypothetical protein
MRELAKQLGVSRGTVDRTLEVDRPPKYERKPAGSSFDSYAAHVRALCVDADDASIGTGRTRRLDGLCILVPGQGRGLRPEYMPADPVDRLVHRTADAMRFMVPP